MPHTTAVFYNFAPEAEKAIASVVTFIAEHTTLRK